MLRLQQVYGKVHFHTLLVSDLLIQGITGNVHNTESHGYLDSKQEDFPSVFVTVLIAASSFL